jgi:hypothetical protein
VDNGSGSDYFRGETKNDMKNTFHAFKKTESGQYFIQWRKGGKFVQVETELAIFTIFHALNK